MSPRFVLVVVVLLAILGGGALLYQTQERSRRPDNVATLGQNLLKDLQGRRRRRHPHRRAEIDAHDPAARTTAG